MYRNNCRTSTYAPRSPHIPLTINTCIPSVNVMSCPGAHDICIITFLHSIYDANRLFLRISRTMSPLRPRNSHVYRGRLVDRLAQTMRQARAAPGGISHRPQHPMTIDRHAKWPERALCRLPANMHVPACVRQCASACVYISTCSVYRYMCIPAIIYFCSTHSDNDRHYTNAYSFMRDACQCKRRMALCHCSGK